MSVQTIPPELQEQARTEGFEWIEAVELRQGDKIRMEASGGHRMWVSVNSAERKPKTIWLSLTYGIKARPRHDDLIPVKR